MRTLQTLISLTMLPLFLAAQAPPPGSSLGAKTPTPPKRGPVVVHRAVYAGTLSEKEARFTAALKLECTNTVETVLPLFQGDIAVSAVALPTGLRLERTGKGYLLAVSKPGEYYVTFNILAKIAKKDPWRQIDFSGPTATIGSVRAEVAGNGMELELLSGIAQPRAAGEKSKVQGALGPDRRVAMRWQTRVTRQERPALLTVQTTSTVQVTPTVIKYTSVYQYNILQGKPTNVVLTLTAGQAVTSVKSNAPLRDRRLENANGQQVLTLDFVQPLTKLYTLTLQTEQPVSQDQNTASLFPPSPQGIERERGQVNLKVQDMKVEPGTPTGLRQVNAAADTVGAWQFFGRDAFAFDIGLRRIDPVITAHDQVIASIEEKRLEVVHSIKLKVEKAGIYKATLTPAAGLLPERMITAVNGKGISDWEEQADGSILVEFNARVLGERQVRVVMEAMFDALPAQVALGTLSVGGAQRQTAQIIANPDRGLELKTAQSSGLREAPAIGALAFTAAAAGWQLEVTPRVLPARIVPRVSNGVIIGDNRVYGYSKILYAINDQGVQEFHVRVPASWQNVQFLGTRKRRELASTPNAAAGAVDHTLTLQDAVWGQYTLQVSYDIPLPEGEGNNTLVLGGTHPLEVDGDGFKLMDRDSGSLVIHSASNIQLSQPETSLSRIDPAELDETERSRITHPVLYAYQYDGGDFQVKVGVGRYREQEMLNAVADYTRLATVVTGTGQIATTASMSVKKTDKDPPVFVLPEGAEFISARIDGKTITPAENDGAYVIPLPGEAGRNRSFEVEISYSEKSGQIKHDDFLRSLQAGHLRLTGPIIRNIPNTFCQWTVYVPEKFEMYNFEGNMVAPPEPKGKKHTLAAVWTQFERSLRSFGGGFILFGFGLACAFATLMAYLRRGWKGSLITLGAIAGVLAFCAVAFSLMMGGMAKARSNSSGSDMTMGVDNESRETLSDPDDRAYGGEEETPKDDASRPGFDPQSKAEPSREQPSPTKATASPKTVVPKTVVPPKATPQGTGDSGGRPSGGSGPDGTPERNGRATLGPATVVGVLPPEFEIPTDGRPYIFTKALHTASLATESQDDQAARLTIEANIIRQDRRKARGIALEWMVALAGLGLLIAQARRRERNSWAITIGFGLMLGGIGKFMLDQGTLHLLFLNSIWVLTLAVAVWATWYFWPAKRHQPTPPPPPSKDEGDSGSGPAPAATTAALLLLLSLSAAQAAAPPPPRDARAWEGLENLLRLLADPDLLLQKPGGPRVIRESQVQDRNGTWFEINQDASFTGQVVGFFQNRQKRIESNYLAGRLHGARSEWFENGQKQRVSAFDQGRLHGVETTWFRDGAKAMETQYQAGRRHGVHRMWHASGKLAMETPYVKGEPHGLTRQWHANGKIAREVRWESGRQLAFDTWTAEGVRFGEGTNTVSLLHAKYKLEVHREVAQVQAEFQLEARAANQKFTLFRELIAINDFNASQAGAKLLREGPALVLQLPEAGKVTVNLSFLTKHAGDATRRTLAFGIPPALTSMVDVVLQEADSEVEMPTAVKFDTSSGGNQTLVDAIIGASDRLELAWKPRVKKAREIAATVFTQTASVVAFGNNRVSTHTVINYSISQGELRETKVVLPPGKDWKLMKVDGGKQLRTYQLDTQDGQSVLTALLINGVTQKFQLTLELERGLPAPPIALPILLPRSLAGTVQRETGYIALQSSAELGLSMDQANGLTQVDVQEFARSTKQAVPTNATAFAYNTPSYTLAAQVESIEPEIEAVARHLTHITEEKLRVTTHVEYTIKHVGVFKFELALPEGSFDVQGVRGQAKLEWEEKTIDGTRRLVVTLKQRTSGQYPLRVDLSQSLATLPAQITARGAHPLGVHKLTNLVGVYAEEGVVVVEVADSRSQALNEMSTARLAATAVVVNPPNAPPQQRDGVGDIPGIPANANALAYRHFNETPANTPAWTLEVATRRLEPWVRNAQIVNWMRLGQTRVSGYTRVRYEVERAPVRQFTLLLPNNFNTNHTRFTGAGIRSRESNPTDLGRLYTITLQDKVRPGEIYTLNINWELASWDVENNGTLVFQGPVTQGKNLPAATQARYTAAGMDSLVEGEEGWLVVSDDPRAQLMLEAGDNLTGLERKNTGDLPEWAAASSEGARQVWYYFRPGYSLTLNTKMLKDAAVDPAWINQALFRSVVADDGQMMTHMALSVNNNGKQFLGITLPGDNPRVLSVFVNGQARRPTRKEGRILVPLEYSSDIGAFPVEMVYTSEIKFPRDGGRVEMKSPQFDVKLNSAKWRFYLPEDYKYSDYKGTMDFLQRGLQRQPATALRDWRQNDDRKKQTAKYFNTIDEMERADEEQYSNSFTTGELASGKPGNYYSQETYAAQERFNTKKALDNIARSQVIVISNLESGKLATANRASGQALNNLNDLTQQVRGKGTKDENKQLERLLTNQRDLDSRRRTAQVRQEQKAQYEFKLRNSDLAKTPRRNAGNVPNFAIQTSRALPNGPGQMGGMVGGGMGGGGGMIGKMGQQVTPALFTDAETNERQARQVEEIERIQKRVADGTITPLYINLPTHGEPYAFNQPLQTDTGAPMTVSFEVENTRRTNWMTLILWSTLALAVLHLMVNLIRQLALHNPRAAKA